jgi:hypothetical protein
MADAIILQGHLTQAQFDANPTFVLGDGQIAWLKDDSGKFKKGDGVTALIALPFIQYSKDLSTVLGVGNTTSGENIIITNADSIKSSKVTNPSDFNFGSNGDEFQLTNDDSGFAKAWLYGSDNESALGFADNDVRVKVSEIILTHDIKNTFNAPNNNFPQESANQIAVFDASSNLKSGTLAESDIALKTQLGTSYTHVSSAAANLADSTIYIFGQETLGSTTSGNLLAPQIRSKGISKTGVIKKVVVSLFVSNSTTTSAETSNIYLRNHTTNTNYLLGTILFRDALTSAFDQVLTGLNIPVTIGDSCTTMVQTPVFATNPTSTYIHVDYIIE